jgi:hypothetical protein
MPAQARHLHRLPDSRPRACRTVSCLFEGAGTLGFCPACESVYQAALELRERLLARRGAQLRAARPALFEGMAPDMRARLLAHVAAQSAHRGRPASVFDLCGLEDFLAELRELGLGDLT